MSFHRTVIAAVCLASLAAKVSAQVDASQCVAFIDAIGKNTLDVETHSAAADALFDEHCFEGKWLSEGQTTVNADVEWSSFLFGGDFDQTQASKRLEEFCKTHDTSAVEEENTRLALKQISPDAISAFEVCVQEAANGFRITPDIDIEGITIAFGAGGNSLKITGAPHSTNLDCKMTTENGETTAADDSFVLTVPAGQSATLHCSRTLTTLENGSQGFNRSRLVVGFSAGRLLPISLAGDRLISPPTANDLSAADEGLRQRITEQARIAKDLEGRIKAAEADITQLEARAGNLQEAVEEHGKSLDAIRTASSPKTIFGTWVAGAVPNGNHPQGLPGRYGNQCPPGQFVVSVQSYADTIDNAFVCGSVLP